MKTRRIAKMIMSIVLSALMVLATIVPQQIEVYADSGTTSGFEVILGSKSEITDGRFTFPNADITTTGSDKITSLTISVDKGGIDIETVPSNVGKMTDKLTTHQTLTCYWNSGETVDNVKSILKNVKFIYAQGMKATVTVDANEVKLPGGNATITTAVLSNPSTLEMDGTIHYYIYVATNDSSKYHGTKYSNITPATWKEAYDEAKTWYFMGMQGYLATITEISEDKILNNITDAGAWAGGARLINTHSSFDGDSSEVYSQPSTAVGSVWFWVNGPEKGSKIRNKGGSDSSKTGNTQYGADIVEEGYSNWRRNGTSTNTVEPNNYNKEEWCLQVHYPDDTTGEQGSVDPAAGMGWNDLPLKGNSSGEVKGYFVEFSQYQGAPGTCNPTKQFTITQDVDHIHSFVPTADDTTDTITYKCSGCSDEYNIILGASNATYTGLPYSVESLNITDAITGTFTDKFDKKIEYYGSSYEKSEIPPTDAGDYEVTITLIDKVTGDPVQNGTNIIAVSKAFSINKKEVTVTVNSQEVNIGNSISSTTGDITVNGLVGEDTLESVSLVIGDASSTVTQVTSYTQNGSDISVKSDGIVIKNGTAVKTGNYTFNVTKGQLTAKKNSLTVTTPPTVGAITYDNNVGSSTITGGVVKDGDTVVNGTWSWKSDDANDKPGVDKSDNDSYKWTLVFTPTDSDKYDPIEYTTKLTINPKEVSVSWSDDTYTYDGTDYIPTATVDTADLVGSDTCGVTVAVTKNGTTESVEHPKYAGDYTAKATSTNNNYVIKTTDNSKDYSIAKKDITLIAPSDSVAKDSTSTNLTKDKITVDPDLVSGDSLTDATITHTDGADDYKTVGEHEISIDESSIKIMNDSDDVTGSYNITVTKGKLTVDRKALSDAENHKPAVTITYGDKLGDLSVLEQLVSTNGTVMDDGTEVTGHWEWDKNEDPDVDTAMPQVNDTDKTYHVKFVPDDTTNYSEYMTTVTITVNPKPIDVTWDKDSFVYNGKEQIPTPTAIAGDLVGSDTVEFTVDGKRINVGDDYTASITATNNSNYVVKDASKIKEFKITATSIDPEVNDKIKITVTYDLNDEPVVRIYDEESQKELTNGIDFEVIYTQDPNSEYNDVKITGKGNYSGNTSRLVKNIRYQGLIRSIVDLDPSSAEYAPKMNAVPDDKALALVEERINSITKDASGKHLMEEQKDIARRIMEDYKDPISNYTSSLGELKADVILTMKELNDEEIGKLKDSDPTLKERIETDMQLVQTVMAMPEHKSELEGMTVGGYLDLNLYVRYSITPDDPDIVAYSTPNIQLYDNLGFEQEVTITIPQRMLPANGHSRTYTVVRIHYPNGDTTETPVKDVLNTTRNGNELTFTTGMFSTYAILYRDTLDPVPPQPTPDPDPKPSGATPAKPIKTPINVVAPKTADTVDVFVAWGMLFAGVITLLGCIYVNKKADKKYKRGM